MLAEPISSKSRKKSRRSDSSEFVPSEESDDDEEYEVLEKSRKKGRKSGSSSRSSSDDFIESDDNEDYKSAGLLDDNDSKNFKARIDKLKPEATSELVDTRMVTSEEYGKSSKPWKVNAGVWNKLHKFQQEGVEWLQKKTDHRSGGILADEMGLGKTIQSVVFLRSIQETARTHYKTTGLDTALIVCHVSIIAQWIKELNQWFPKARVFLLHSHCSTGRQEDYVGSIFRKLQRRRKEYPDGAIILTTYSLFTKLKKPIVKHLWQVVILDEGHYIRNENTKCSIAMRKLMTTQRFILTGTPFQNRLSEFWKLVDFVHPGRLSDSATFHRNFTHIINAGANLNCSPEAAAKAYECLVALHIAVKPLILRRLQEDHKEVLQLPEKQEIVLSCELSKRQRRLYMEYGNSHQVNEIIERRLKAFVGINHLTNICNHPGIYRSLSPASPKFGSIKDSGKVEMTFKLFDDWFKSPTNRVILFTQRRTVITMMEYFLAEKGIKCVSLTGADSAAARPKIIKKFEDDVSIKVFLMTTRAGGLGLNLTCANKVIIFDPDWNPQADNQAKNRIYRMGQTNDVAIYRLVSNGTIEDLKFFKQVQKENLAARLLHNAEIDQFVPNNTLADLFRLKPKGLEGSEIGVYLDGEIAREGSKKQKRDKVEKKAAKKRMKNKLAGFEDKKLLLSLFDDDKLVAMREHSISLQNSSSMNRIEKMKMRKSIDDAVGSLLHTEGRLAHTWKQVFHKQLRKTLKKSINGDYFVEEEQLDSYWNTVHSGFRANDDQRELDRLVKLATDMLQFFNGVPGAKEDSIHRIFVKDSDRKDPTQMFFIQEIISTLAKYDDASDTWILRDKYRSADVLSPVKKKNKRRSDDNDEVDAKRARKSREWSDSSGPSTSRM